MIEYKYSYTQDSIFNTEVNITLTELQKEFKHLSKITVKDWVLSGGKEIIKGGKIKLFKRNE